MRLLVLDNYDSFTWNLVHLVEKVSHIPFDVIQNDRMSLADVTHYDLILLSPGPGLPSEAGIMPQLIQHYHTHKSILGICLGMQAIAESFGARLINPETPAHGIATPIQQNAEDALFDNCPPRFLAGRYHSWVVDRKTLSREIEVTAEDEQGQVMALQHTVHDLRGVQFHPESILSEHGETILHNWLQQRLREKA